MGGGGWMGLEEVEGEVVVGWDGDMDMDMDNTYDSR